MRIVELNNISALVALLDKIAHLDDQSWGVACVRKAHLKPITNEAFLLALAPALHEARGDVSVCFEDNKKIYIVWNGEQKNIFKRIRGVVLATFLVQTGESIEPLAVISYINLRLHCSKFKEVLEVESGKAVSPGLKSKGKEWLTKYIGLLEFEEEGIEEDTEEESIAKGANTCVSPTPEQICSFIEVKNQRSYRKQIQILVVEDQLFSQRLLCEVLRGARINKHEAPLVDAAQGIKEAWALFLKKAHDIVFVDLSLADGSGHALTRAIKELDPMTHVIIVTSNTYEGEVNVARQNNVDGYIIKPYTKKQILDYLEKYTGNHKGGGRGSFGQF